MGSFEGGPSHTDHGLVYPVRDVQKAIQDRQDEVDAISTRTLNVMARRRAREAHGLPTWDLPGAREKRDVRRLVNIMSEVSSVLSWTSLKTSCLTLNWSKSPYPSSRVRSICSMF